MELKYPTEEPIWRVVLQARPRPSHHRYVEMQYCFVHFWVLASTKAEAGEKGIAILKQLPYDLVNPVPLVIQDGIWPGEKMDEILQGEREAGSVGLGMMVAPILTGTMDPFPYDWAEA